MRIRLLFALSGLSGLNGHRRFAVVQTRTGDGSGAQRSVHGFWQGPAADLPDADRDNNRPQHIPPSTLRARPSTKKHRLLRCQLCRLCGHDACTRNVLGASRRNDSQRGRPSKSGEWLLTACEGGWK
ncbi:hypothetical protein TcG_11967 [Trypanosoma cruzi]|nr:hypothetical protein TcG_11967 [Trypanosoma cruzi]